ncbi:MAG: M48 family metallopeptidase [Kiritimatiellia bacterium]|nr:M48 family metallopeptidase [Kiritimatiellia bacterium]
MDFFEHQERARRNTLLLTFFFAVAVVLIIIAVYFVLAFFSLGGRQPTTETDWLVNLKRLWNPVLFLGTAIGTLAVISTGTFYKISRLAAGGEAVARMFGAKQINLQTSEPAERRLLNVVEEIAIAAGTPVPGVYLLDEESINAFAAGFSTRDAIIGVTRGGMTRLSRDELQGVIAHEFSHILNGDMRLNIRLMGVLHGILVISLIGWWIFRISSQSSRSRVSGSARKKGGNTLVILLVGLCFVIIGYIGVFFARLIKSAVSRQREFLADAASVQFTRNPEGIAGALKKIGGFVTGGQISHPSAEDASHFFFADGLKHAFFNLMSTHPPLPERIRRIDPAFAGTFPAAAAAMTFTAKDEISSLNETAARMADDSQSSARAITLDPEQAIKTVGRMDAESLNNVGRWLALLPPAIRSAAREPTSARALIMAMLISGNNEIRNNQLLYLEKNADKNIYKSLLELMPALERSPPEWFLPLADLSTATLRILSTDDLKVFAEQLRHLVESDGTITLFEYMIQARIAGQIKNWARREKGNNFYSSDFQHHLPAMRVVLSTLAYYGNNDDAGAALAFMEGRPRLPQAGQAQILPKNQCGLQATDRALSSLSAAAPRIKKCFLDACCAVVAHDGRVSISEAELLRAVAAILDCPVPPFLPTKIPTSVPDKFQYLK